MSLTLQSGTRVRVPLRAPAARDRKRRALDAARIHVAGLRADSAARDTAIEVAHARRSAIYFWFGVLLVGHVALYGTRLAPGMRWTSAAWIPLAWIGWRAARRSSPSFGRRIAWVTWAGACALATVGIVAARAKVPASAALPATLYGLGTFALGCTLAMDARRLGDREGLRWTLVFVLVLFLIAVHQSLIATLWDAGRDG